MSKVLLVDNKHGHLARLHQQLVSAGIEVVTADCVASALEQAHEGILDLVVCVERLKGLDVFDLLAIKSEQRDLSDIPVVVISTSGRRKLECFKLGCDDFIQLPVDEPELIFRICAVLRRTMKSGLSGSFEHVTFVDLVQMLVAARRDGRLEIEAEEVAGTLYLSEGQVIHALCGKQDGEDAFLSLLRGTRGAGFFVFTTEKFDEIEPTILKRTDHLLLGLASKIDEEQIA